MFEANTYIRRRKVLLDTLSEGLIVFLGNAEVGMNYDANIYHFRQDSTFLYYFGLQVPDMMATLDVGSGEVTLYGNDPTMADMVWTGPQPRLAELGQQCGVNKTAAPSKLSEVLKAAKNSGRTVHYLPPYRERNRRFLHESLGISLAEVNAKASVELIQAVVAQREIKTEEEVAEMEKALQTTHDMHLAMIEGARPGLLEMKLYGKIEGIAASGGGGLAYPVILSVNGQVLHNHHHDQVMQDGQLLLGDFGAQSMSNYAGDITRTTPVGAQFAERQKPIYQAVLDAQMEAIRMCEVGVAYKEIHLEAARIMANGLKDLGIMKGDIDDAVANGAHALFFPHGLGHMIGLDVHDMEDLGEDLVGYSDDVKRSDQFGTAYLRLGKKLKAGFVLTVEPGLYFIPELIAQWKSEKKFEQFIQYAEAEKYLDFGGVRIEDNILVTPEGPKVLGSAIPKTIKDIEAIRAKALV